MTNNIKELIKINLSTIGAEKTNVVDGRELYTFLEVKSHFKDWITRRISEYGFEEGTDFERIALKDERNSGKRGNPSFQAVEYAITLDMAKELAMVEKTDKGREIRRYFIELEKAVVSDSLAILPDPQATIRRQFDTAAKLMGKKALYEFLYKQGVNESNVRAYLQGNKIADKHIDTLERWVPYLSSLVNVKNDITGAVLRFLTNCTPREVTKNLYSIDRIRVTNGNTKVLDALYTLFDEIGETITTFKTDL